MTSLFRSEEMSLVQLFIQSEASYETISELGELGLLQFNDLNSNINSFKRNFVKDIRQCDEMERRLRYFASQVLLSGLEYPDSGSQDTYTRAPSRTEMDDLMHRFDSLERELKALNSNEEMLQRNFLELTELRHILKKTAVFFEEAGRLSFTEDSLGDRAPMLPHVDDVEVGADRGRGSKLAFIAGVIPREKVASFERVLWRACHGNVFMRSSVIEHTLCEPLSGEQVWKNVFVIFYQGETLQNKVKKICEAFGASTYPCPETMMERRELSKQVMTRIEDLQSVLTKTSEHRRRILQTASTSLPVWRVQVLKMKACYHTLNMFNIDVTHKCLIAEAWCPINALNDIQMALARAAERAGSSVPSILNRMATHASPPTFHRTNKFTVGFQNIVDAYGVATYREANPGLFAIITFPFLFAVMFGDFGHGLLMTLFALFLLLKEKSLINYRGGGEMFDTVFGGRYIIFLMGIFSMYTGLIYNDTFSKPMNLFGTSWALPAAANGTVHLSPSQDFSGTPYLIGIDPLWNVADNKLTFSNSFKMKTAVILGVLQMTFGIILSFTNHRYFKRPLNIYCEFIPQLIFLLAIFGYLSLLILYKWAADWYQVGRFPSLLLTLINMFLSFGTVKPEDRLFRGQAFLQNSLVLLALVCVPWMLFTKPFLLQRKHSMKKSARLQRRRSRSISVSSLSSDTGLLFSATDPPPSEDADHPAEFDFADLMVHQCIHTIEFCLGAISNTASYLRLWALSLAHAQLSDVLWSMVLNSGLNGSHPLILVFSFFFWAILTLVVLLIMEGMSAFLHALRLHWVEFNGKFYGGTGYLFTPFSFDSLLNEPL